MKNNMQFVENVLPYSKEAEETVVGCILADSSCMGDAVETVKPEDFYLTSTREIYIAELQLFNENQPIDFVSVSELLTRSDKLEAVGGTVYLATLASSVPTNQHVKYYATIISEKSLLRHLILTSQKIGQNASMSSDDVSSILEQSEQMIFDVVSKQEKGDIVPIKSIIMDSYNEMVENSMNAGKVNGLDTGFRELNYRTGGLHGGELILIAGRPGMGKSSLAVNIAEHVALINKQTVAIFNLEMPRNQIVSRIICSQAAVDSQKIKLGELHSGDWVSIGKVLNRFFTAPLFIDDTSTITVSEIRAKCKRLKQTNDLKLIIIDYLQLMQSPRRTDNRQQEIAEISRSLKILAKELNIPVIALSQLSRTVESRTEKRPMLSDLRESGAIEQDADIVMFLYRDDYYNKESADKDIAECNIAKHRSGETGMFKLGWKGSLTKFLNVEYEQKKDEQKNN